MGAHTVRIGDTVLPHGLILAPMAGVTDAVFRRICKSHGAEWTVTEMISAKALWYHDKKTAALSALSEEELPAAVQIFGSEPEIMAYAAKTLSEPDPETGHYLSGKQPCAIDINMGCPMPKIAGNGDGAALMRDPVLAGRILEAVVGATPLPVTVKIRTGWDAEHKNCAEIAKIAASCGVSMIAVHGRTRSQLYNPPVDLDAIRSVREAVPKEVPVIGNGDIASPADAERMLAETGCDGVMIGRGACGNPWIFEGIAAVMDGTQANVPDSAERLCMALAHLDLLIGEKGSYTGVQEGRKHLAWYIKGLRGAAALRNTIMMTEDADAVRELLMNALENETPASR